MKFAIAAACAALSFAGAAFADTTVTATLNSPQTGHSKILAAHAIWNCEGSTCVASVAPDETAGVSGCKDLAKSLGPISGYVSDEKTLDSASLEKCNKSAAAPATIGTASR
jgi:hypothetical protein